MGGGGRGPGYFLRWWGGEGGPGGHRGGREGQRQIQGGKGGESTAEQIGRRGMLRGVCGDLGEGRCVHGRYANQVVFLRIVGR